MASSPLHFVNECRQLNEAGRFKDALRCLESTGSTPQNTDAEILRVELLERTGRYTQSRVLIDRLTKTRSLSARHKSLCEFCLGLIDWDEGHSAASIAHFNRSLEQAVFAGDLVRICWAQLRLMVIMASRSTATATTESLAEVRRNVVRVGEPAISAALHILLGEMEAKRGLLRNAKRHTDLGRRLLSGTTNLWLESVAENNYVAICLMRTELMEGLAHAERARVLAEESGAAAMQRAALANLGNLHYSLGNLSKAVEYFEMASRFLPASGEYSNGAMESLARTHLLQSNVEGAVRCLETIENSIRVHDDRKLYANRHSLLTWADAHIQKLDYDAALKYLDTAFALAVDASDSLLLALVRLKKVEIRANLNRQAEAIPDLDDVARCLHNLEPEVFANYERSAGRVSSSIGRHGAAAEHYMRAERIFSGLHNIPGLVEVTQLRNQVELDSGEDPEFAHPDGQSRWSLHEIASLMLYVGRPELLV